MGNTFGLKKRGHCPRLKYISNARRLAVRVWQCLPFGGSEYIIRKSYHAMKYNIQSFELEVGEEVFSFWPGGVGGWPTTHSTLVTSGFVMPLWTSCFKRGDKVFSVINGS